MWWSWGKQQWCQKNNLDTSGWQGTKAAGEVIPIVSVSSVGGCLRGRSRSLIVSGLESFSRGRQNRKSPLEEIKAKQGSNDSARDLVRSRLQENHSDSECRSKEALGRHPLQPHYFTEEDAQVQGGEVTGTRPHS